MCSGVILALFFQNERGNDDPIFCHVNGCMLAILSQVR